VKHRGGDGDLNVASNNKFEKIIYLMILKPEKLKKFFTLLAVLTGCIIAFYLMYPSDHP